MDSQRPSTSKNQAHLKTSRSKIVKELKELLALANEVKDELIFQQIPRYKKFKAKNHNMQRHEMDPIWGNFLDYLQNQEFYKECIYWWTKILEDARMCDSLERSCAIYRIVTSFHNLDDSENVFKYGEKYLEISLQAITSELCSESEHALQRERRRNILCMMQEASRKLNMIGEFQYSKEILKLDVLRYNAKEIDDSELLGSYWNFIRMQIEIGDFKSAKKTLKHLKLFSLNSINTSDVIKAMKIFQWDDLDYDNPDDKIKLFEKDIILRWYISRICWQKQEILMNFDEIPVNLEWGHLVLNILLQVHLDYCRIEEIAVEMEGSAETAENNIGIIRIEILRSALLLADKDHMNRQNLFAVLKEKIYFEKWPLFIYILSAQRQNLNLDVQKVMPFLEFCLKSFNEGATSHEVNVLRVQLTTFKNSLAIMNHFESKF